MVGSFCDPLFGLVPTATTQAAETQPYALSADVAAQPVGLVDGDVELVTMRLAGTFLVPRRR